MSGTLGDPRPSDGDDSRTTPGSWPPPESSTWSPPASAPPHGAPESPANPYAAGLPPIPPVGASGPYGAGPGYTPDYAPAKRTNASAIVALVCGLALMFYPLNSILAIVFGHVASRQIRHSGEEGRGMAVAGLALGYAGIALGVVAIVALVLFVVTVSSSGY